MAEVGRVIPIEGDNLGVQRKNLAELAKVYSELP
jgi:hypothetical protein